MDEDLSHLIFGIVMPVVVVTGSVLLFWVLPVWLGLRWAGRKGYSRLWMLFGLHPLGAWIAAAILQVLPPRSRCAGCDRFVRDDFSVCPYCGHRREKSAEVDVVEFVD